MCGSLGAGATKVHSSTTHTCADGKTQVRSTQEVKFAGVADTEAADISLDAGAGVSGGTISSRGTKTSFEHGPCASAVTFHFTYVAPLGPGRPRVVYTTHGEDAGVLGSHELFDLVVVPPLPRTASGFGEAVTATQFACRVVVPAGGSQLVDMGSDCHNHLKTGEGAGGMCSVGTVHLLGQRAVDAAGSCGIELARLPTVPEAIYSILSLPAKRHGGEEEKEEEEKGEVAQSSPPSPSLHRLVPHFYPYGPTLLPSFLARVPLDPRVQTTLPRRSFVAAVLETSRAPRRRPQLVRVDVPGHMDRTTGRWVPATMAYRPAPSSDGEGVHGKGAHSLVVEGCTEAYVYVDVAQQPLPSPSPLCYAEACALLSRLDTLVLSPGANLDEVGRPLTMALSSPPLVPSPGPAHGALPAGVTLRRPALPTVSGPAGQLFDLVPLVFRPQPSEQAAQPGRLVVFGTLRDRSGSTGQKVGDTTVCAAIGSLSWKLFVHSLPALLRDQGLRDQVDRIAVVVANYDSESNDAQTTATFGVAEIREAHDAGDLSFEARPNVQPGSVRGRLDRLFAPTRPGGLTSFTAGLSAVDRALRVLAAQNPHLELRVALFNGTDGGHNADYSAEPTWLASLRGMNAMSFLAGGVVGAGRWLCPDTAKKFAGALGPDGGGLHLTSELDVERMPPAFALGQMLRAIGATKNVTVTLPPGLGLVLLALDGPRGLQVRVDAEGTHITGAAAGEVYELLCLRLTAGAGHGGVDAQAASDLFARLRRTGPGTWRHPDAGLLAHISDSVSFLSGVDNDNTKVLATVDHGEVLAPIDITKCPAPAMQEGPAPPAQAAIRGATRGVTRGVTRGRAMVDDDDDEEEEEGRGPVKRARLTEFQPHPLVAGSYVVCPVMEGEDKGDGVVADRLPTVYLLWALE